MSDVNFCILPTWQLIRYSLWRFKSPLEQSIQPVQRLINIEVGSDLIIAELADQIRNVIAYQENTVVADEGADGGRVNV